MHQQQTSSLNQQQSMKNPQMQTQQQPQAPTSIQATTSIATPFVEFEADDIAMINTGGKSTQTKKINDFTDLKSFKNAQKQIKAAQGCNSVDQQPGNQNYNNATSSSFPQSSTNTKKNQGVTGQNMQNMINSEGPIIIGPPDFVHHSTSNVVVAKTNPTSMRDKFKMENPGKKILTPRGGGQHATTGAVSSSNTSTKGGGLHHHHHLNAQQASMSGNLMQRQNFHEIDAYSSEQVSGRGGAGTTGTLSIKHHESISGLSGSANTTKGGKNATGNNKRQGIMTATLSEIDKKHMGLPSSGGHSSTTNTNHHAHGHGGIAMTTSKKHVGGGGGQPTTGASSSKNSAGRGAGGSIDLLSGVTSLSQIKSKSIHGQKISEVTVQSNQVLKHGGSLHGGTATNTNTANNGNHQQTPSFHSTTMTSKQQFSLNSNKQGSLLTAMIQTPQKFRVKNSSHQSAKKSSMLKGQHHTQSMGPMMADNSCSTSVKNNYRGQQAHHGGSTTVYNQRDSFENQRLVTGAKSQPGSSGGTANRKGQQLLSTNLSKVTSEKKLTGVAGSTISDAASHISPRDTNTGHHSHSKGGDSKHSQGSKLHQNQAQQHHPAGGGKNSTTSKKVPPSSTHHHHQHSGSVTSANNNVGYMNEYLVESQKNMKQLQQHHQQSNSTQFQTTTQTVSHTGSLVFAAQRSDQPIQLMSTTVMPQSSTSGGSHHNQQRAAMMHQNSSQAAATSTTFDLKKKKPSQASMRQLQSHHHHIVDNHQNSHMSQQQLNFASQQSGKNKLLQQPQNSNNVVIVSSSTKNTSTKAASRRSGTGTANFTTQQDHNHNHQNNHHFQQHNKQYQQQHNHAIILASNNRDHQQFEAQQFPQTVSGGEEPHDDQKSTDHIQAMANHHNNSSSGVMNNNPTVSSREKSNLFYKVQDATLCQDQATDQEMIEYYEDNSNNNNNFEPQLSAKKSSKQGSVSNHQQKAQNSNKKYPSVAVTDTHTLNINNIIENVDACDDIDDDVQEHEDDEIDEDMEADGVPVIAELVEDEDIFRKPSSPIHQAEGIIEQEGGDMAVVDGVADGEPGLLEDIDGYVEHRNVDANQFNINALSGQKTEIYNDRQSNVKLFKKPKVERTQQVKSLLQPSQSNNEMDKFIYNARSGLPNQNFNFAKNQNSNHQQSSSGVVGQRPTSTKQGQKTLTCWTGSLAQANYTSSTKHLSGVASAKNQNGRSIVGGSFNNTISFQKVGLGAQYNKTSQRTAKGSNNATANTTTASGAKVGSTSGSLSHSKAQSQTQKDIYKVHGGTSSIASAVKKKNSVQNNSNQQQQSQQQSELVTANKVTSSSFETRPGSQSMSYIPPRRIQDQTLQLIQVPLSRAELNNQSAYHLADSQYGVGPAGSHHHKSISYCKDDVRAFNRSLQKNNSTSTQSKNMLKNQAGPTEKIAQGGSGGAGGMYQTSATVTVGLKHVDPQSVPFKLQKTVMIPGSTSGTHGNIDAPNGGVTSATVHVFSRSQSNQQISTTHNAAVTNTINGPGKRMTNSQSRGKQRGDHLQALHGGSNVVSPNPSINIESRSSIKQLRGAEHQISSHHQTGGGIKKGSSSQGQGQKTSSQLQSNMNQTTKLARKNQNNLKMSTMQLRDQDFKKITSQIQSQTMTNAAVNAKKKKIQFHHHHHQQQHQSIKGSQQVVSSSGVSSQAPASTTRLNNQPPGSVGHADQLELPQKFISTSKIYSPHRRSIQQVSNPNMGAYLNPIDAVADLPQETSSNGGGGTTAPGTGNYTGSRKFAYSLTDKYKGGFEELCWKQPGVYSGSHVSSSDGGASYIIPSENERIVEQQQQQQHQTAKRKDKSKVQQPGATSGSGTVGGVSSSSKVQQKIGGTTSGSGTTTNAANSKRLSNMAAGSQASLNQQQASQQAAATGNNMNMFFPDPSSAGFFERKKSSMERTTNTVATVSHHHHTAVTSSQQNNIGKSRGSSKHIEQPHRMVKVSKPFASSQSKKSSLHGGQKGSNTGGKGGGGLTSTMQQMQQPTPIMAVNPNAQKKSGSFGGGYKEPSSVDIVGHGASGVGPRIQNSGSFTTSTHTNNHLNSNHQVLPQQHPSTAPVSHHTTSNQAKIPLDSRCQSPEQPPRKNNALHLNSHGPGSLIANANLIKQQSPNVSSHRQQDGGSLSGSFTGQNQQQLPQQQQPLSNNAGERFHHQSQIITVVSAKNAVISSSNKQIYGAKNAAILAGTKSPGKKVNKKLSHKMQNVGGYTTGMNNEQYHHLQLSSTATKKMILSSTNSNSNSNTNMNNYNTGHSSTTAAYKTATGASQQLDHQASGKVFKNMTGVSGGSMIATTAQQNSQDVQQQMQHHSSQVVDKQKNQNIQLLQKVHHKQITTASKGKDSGSVKKLQQQQHTTTSNGKSLSVLIPSSESVAQSKAILLDTSSGAQSKAHQSNHQVHKNIVTAGGSMMDQQRSSLGAGAAPVQGSSTDRGEIRLGGGSLVIPSTTSQQSQLQQQPLSNAVMNKNYHQHHQNNAVNKNYNTCINNRFQKDSANSVAASPKSEKRTPGAKSEQHASQKASKKSKQQKQQSSTNSNQQMAFEQASDNDHGKNSNTDGDDTTILQDGAPSSAASCAASSKKASFISGGKYNGAGNRPLNVIEERLESQDSAVSDPNLSPRSRHILKIQKKIKFAFLKQGAPPETQTENYKIGKVMGKGAFGKVNLAIHRLAGKFVALKSINKQFLTQEQSKRKVMQEFNILRRTRHCNIVRLYESFETQQHIVFVMEVCGGGDLLTYVRRRRKLKEDTARFLFKQIITGLAYCHIKNVLHRDIKLDNILLTSQGDVKICDFGVSKLVTPGEQMTEQCGTPAYIAPEVFKNLGYEGFASDIWSAGVVLYAMLFGAVPFKASNMAELHKYVLERQPTYKEEEISSDALALLKGILEKDPKKRLTSDQILSHPWMIQKKSTAKGSKLVNVFTEQEKEGIVSEFEYYNKRERDVIVDGEHQVVPTDPFAEQMLSSAQDTELKNVSTRSIILAPFNSTRSQLVYSHEEGKMMKEMLMPRTAVKFSARVKEIDRQYELNNNADLDNGVYHQDEDEEESKDDCSPPAGSNPPRPTEERPETRARIRAHDEASIADSFNQEQLHSQLDELDEANNSINSAELDEGGRQRNETNYVSPASVRPLTSEQMQINKNQKKNDKNEQQQPNNQNKLSEWRKLEKQMIKGDGQSSPPKQSLFNQRINEDIKGDKAIPDSGDLILDQSYEQVQIELYDDLATGSANNSREGGSTALQVNLQKVTNAAISGQSNQQRQTMVIDEASVTEIEKCGYPKPYIMASLNNDDLNHVTTFYYLLQTQKEY